MTNEEWSNLIRMIPEADQPYIVLQLKCGAEVSVANVFKIDQNFFTVRGRSVGSTDEGRLFFVPFESLEFMKIERIVKESEARKILGMEISAELLELEAARAAGNLNLVAEIEARIKAGQKTIVPAEPAQAQPVAPAVAPTEPAAPSLGSPTVPTGSTNLLEKIRAVKAASLNKGTQQASGPGINRPTQ